MQLPMQSVYHLAITTLRAPDARFAQSKEASFRPQLYAPTLRCRCVATARFPQVNDNQCMVSIISFRLAIAFVKAELVSVM